MINNSRRTFFKSASIFALGLGLAPLIGKSASKNKQSINNFSKGNSKRLRISGQVLNQFSEAKAHSSIEFWHNNIETNEENFTYKGTLKTDELGNFSFETDFPEKHFTEGQPLMRRLFLKVQGKDENQYTTQLLFNGLGKAFIDNQYFEQMSFLETIDLPKTDWSNDDLVKVKFNIYINSKIS
ncbi:MAG: hypothetical protein KA313_00110 [Pseudarcicella sp.]|nr:hypothetical protein [Pseudarcicella sp.]